MDGNRLLPGCNTRGIAANETDFVARMVDGYLYVTDGTSVKVFDATGTKISTTGTFSPGFTPTSG